MDIESLPDGVLERILLRLPTAAILLYGKQVCKKWKGVIESSSFRRAYRDRATLVEQVIHGKGIDFSYEIIDSSSTVLRLRKPRHAIGAITAHTNGLLMAYVDRKYFVCNIFTDQWEEIPKPPKRTDVRDAAIFDLGGGQYKVVDWSGHTQEIRALATGQQGWSTERRDQLHELFSPPVVIGSSIFRVRHDGALVEYSIQGRFSCKPITSQAGTFDLDVYRKIETVVWRDELYLVLAGYDAEEQQSVEVWRLSRNDGRATFMNRIDMVGCPEFFYVMAMEGDVLRLEGIDMEKRRVFLTLYDMSTNLVLHNGVTESKTVRRPMAISVSLNEFRILCIKKMFIA